MKKIITTAQRGAYPNWGFVRSLEAYAKVNKAEIIILPTNGMYPSSTKQDQQEKLHPYLRDRFRTLEHDERLNQSIDIRHFPVKAQQMDPSTSWDRFVKGSSAIMPSPKQRMRVVPTSNQKFPKILMSTGAITQPHYKDNSWGAKAALDHVYGAIMVDVFDDTKFHFRQLRSSDNGAFYDLGVKYTSAGKGQLEPVEALVLGDFHARQIDLAVLTASYALMREVKPKIIVLHDLFDGYSISHHDLDKLVRRAEKKAEFGTSLLDELANCGEHLERIKKQSNNANVLVIKSNHDEVIDRYLEEGRFAKDPENIDIALKIFEAKRQGRDPIQAGIEYALGHRIKGVKFLGRNDDYKVQGWQLANHGDLGANGGRPGIRTLENDCNKAIYGHSHTPQIMRDVIVVGTSTPLKLDYNRGASSWMNTHALLHPNAQPQLVNIFDGKYK